MTAPDARAAGVQSHRPRPSNSVDRSWFRNRRHWSRRQQAKNDRSKAVVEQTIRGAIQRKPGSIREGDTSHEARRTQCHQSKLYPHGAAVPDKCPNRVIGPHLLPVGDRGNEQMRSAVLERLPRGFELCSTDRFSRECVAVSRKRGLGVGRRFRDPGCGETFPDDCENPAEHVLSHGWQVASDIAGRADAVHDWLDHEDGTDGWKCVSERQLPPLNGWSCRTTGDDTGDDCYSRDSCPASRLSSGATDLSKQTPSPLPCIDRGN